MRGRDTERERERDTHIERETWIGREQERDGIGEVRGGACETVSYAV